MTFLFVLLILVMTYSHLDCVQYKQECVAHVLPNPLMAKVTCKSDKGDCECEAYSVGVATLSIPGTMMNCQCNYTDMDDAVLSSWSNNCADMEGEICFGVGISTDPQECAMTAVGPALMETEKAFPTWVTKCCKTK